MKSVPLSSQKNAKFTVSLPFSQHSPADQEQHLTALCRLLSEEVANTAPPALKPGSIFLRVLLRGNAQKREQIGGAYGQQTDQHRG